MTHFPTDATRAQVIALSAFGVPQDEMADYLGISDDTLRKYYADEMAKSKIEKNMTVAAFLYRAASGAALEQGASHADCLKAAMFYLKTRAEWRETNRTEHVSPDGSMTPRDTSAAVLAALQRKHDDAG